MSRADSLADEPGRSDPIERAARDAGRPRVSYARARIPSRDEVTEGGVIRLQALHEVFPNTPRQYDILYLLSYTLPRRLRLLLHAAAWRGARIVWDQDGVAYPGWHGRGWERTNRPLALGVHTADYVFYQSRFCKLSADRFLGERRGPSEILYNAVDTARFTPAPRPDRPPTLMLFGNQYQRYRLECALQAHAVLVRELPTARLLVAGALSFAPDALAGATRLMRELGIEDRVELLGPYSQQQAPGLLARADILVHTKYNDPCPRAVIEALSCGLPVVYSASGGVPEIVGDEAGVGLSAPLDWDHDHPPDPAALAAGARTLFSNLPRYCEAARQRAIDRFDITPWIARHRVVFDALGHGVTSPR